MNPLDPQELTDLRDSRQSQDCRNFYEAHAHLLGDNSQDPRGELHRQELRNQDSRQWQY